MNPTMKASCVVALCVSMLAACSKSTTNSAATATAPAAGDAVTTNGAMASSGAMALNSKMNGAEASAGAKVFANNCATCHQANGMGIPGTFPPLAGNPVVVGNSQKIIHIVKFGLNGRISVEGHTYNGQMPMWGTQLSPADIASAVTYIRSAWGNKASAVSEAEVKAVKD